MISPIDRPALARLLLLIGLSACSGDGITDPPGTTKPPEELNILELPADHPPFFNTSAH